MACSPEQSRINGRKSKGPKSNQGKAIAARNATKHGLLAEKPPLLASEDLTTFQGLLQALIDEWQPQGATEQILVQQLAMAFQRQYRLWSLEAALGDKPALEAEKQRRFPDKVVPGPLGESNSIDALSELIEKRISYRDHLKDQIERLRQIHEDFDAWLTDANNSEFLEELETDGETLQDCFAQSLNKCKLFGQESIWQRLRSFLYWLGEYEKKGSCQAPLDETLETATRLRDQLSAALTELESEVIALEAFEAKQAQNEVIAQQLPLPSLDLLMRYESSIRSSLESAIAQLEAAQNRRKATVE